MRLIDRATNHYLQVDGSRCAKTLKKNLILVMGTPGSGKTTLARQLAERMGATYLCSDSMSEPLFPDDRESDAYQQARGKLYLALYGIADDNLRCGNSVVLDAPHIKLMLDVDWRRKITALAADTGSGLKVIRARCSPEQLRARIEARGQARDRAKLADWDGFLKDQPLDAAIPREMPSVDIDTEAEIEKQIEKAIVFIDASSKRKPGTGSNQD